MKRTTADSKPIPRILITPGEPAGIGPELCVQIAQQTHGAELIAVADPELLRNRATQLGLPLRLNPVSAHTDPRCQRAGSLGILPVHLYQPAEPGRLDTGNAAYVLETLKNACDGCLSGEFQALVTGPVHKGVINDAGIAFSGHTEFLAERCHAFPVMMLATPGLRVALATTHLPLSAVSAAITPERLDRVIRILYRDLRERFHIAEPHVIVCGLNPHAGEGGHLGREELEIIEPLLERLRGEGFDLTGPLPADTAFVPDQIAGGDAVLAMYHDQGLPVLKHLGFGKAVNITLGLPIIRTSVDHGTALDLAGSGRAETGSLETAIAAAIGMCGREEVAS